MRLRIFQIVQLAEEGDTVSRAYDIALIVISLVSIAPMLFHADSVTATQLAVLNVLDIATVYFLMLDYLMRWVTHDIKRGTRNTRGKWLAFFLYPITPLALIDLLAILPTLLPSVEVIQLFRLLRLLKLLRASRSLKTVENVFRYEGKTLISVFGVVILFIFASGTILYVNEPKTFDDAFINALYWAANALTTVGYGDYAPTTEIGQLINTVSAIFGIAVVALPTGIITAGYVAEQQRQRARGKKLIAEEEIDLPFTIRSARRARRVADEIGRISPKEYYAAHPGNLYCLSVIVGCIVLSSAFLLIEGLLQVGLSLDIIGCIIAGMILEPVAGIIVAFFNSMLYSIVIGDIGSIYFFLFNAVIAYVLARLLSVHRASTPKHYVLALVMTVAFCTLFVGLYVHFLPIIMDVTTESFIQSCGQPYLMLFESSTQAGAPLGLAAFLALAIPKVALALLAFAAAVLTRHLYANHTSVRRQAALEKPRGDDEIPDNLVGFRMRIQYRTPSRERELRMYRRAHRKNGVDASLADVVEAVPMREMLAAMDGLTDTCPTSENRCDSEGGGTQR